MPGSSPKRPHSWPSGISQRSPRVHWKNQTKVISQNEVFFLWPIQKNHWARSFFLKSKKKRLKPPRRRGGRDFSPRAAGIIETHGASSALAQGDLESGCTPKWMSRLTCSYIDVFTMTLRWKSSQKGAQLVWPTGILIVLMKILSISKESLWSTWSTVSWNHLTSQRAVARYKAVASKLHGRRWEGICKASCILFEPWNLPRKT